MTLVVHWPLAQSHSHPSHCLPSPLMTLQDSLSFALFLFLSIPGNHQLLLTHPYFPCCLRSNPLKDAVQADTCIKPWDSRAAFKLPVSGPSYIWSPWSIWLLAVVLTEPGELLCPCSVLEKYVTCSQGDESIKAKAASARLVTREKLCHPAWLLRELRQKQRH